MSFCEYDMKDRIIVWVLGTAIVLGFVGMTGWAFHGLLTLPYDDTDPASHGGSGRSGLYLYTDAGTGCQYLSKPFDVLIPRLDASGKHICNRSSP